MFRVYDLVNKKWVSNDVYVDMMGHIYLESNSFIGKIFGLKKLKDANDGDIVLHGYTNKNDSNGVPIYEGDICLIDEVNTIGFVAYAAEIATYCIFDESKEEYYILSGVGDDKIKVIGNLIDSPGLLPRSEKTEKANQQQVGEPLDSAPVEVSEAMHEEMPEPVEAN